MECAVKALQLSWSEFVSILGNGVQVLVMIFRDPGDFDSFIIASVLPLKEESETGDFFPFHKMGFSVMLASLYKVMLDRDLFQDEAKLLVQPALPIKGVLVILSDDLAGTRVMP